jgi:hypothetical protein
MKARLSQGGARCYPIGRDHLLNGERGIFYFLPGGLEKWAENVLASAHLAQNVTKILSTTKW